MELKKALLMNSLINTAHVPYRENKDIFVIITHHEYRI